MVRSVDRREYLKNIRRVVIKIGSRVLTDDAGALDVEVIKQISSDIASSMRNGLQVILVSSGAVAAGRTRSHAAVTGLCPLNCF